MSSARSFVLDNIDWLALVVVVVAYFAQAQGWIVIDAETVAAAASLGIVLRGVAERRRRGATKKSSAGAAGLIALALVTGLGCGAIQAQQQESTFERIAECVPGSTSMPALAVCLGVPPELAGFSERALPCVEALRVAQDDPWGAIGECGPLVELVLEASELE